MLLSMATNAHDEGEEEEEQNSDEESLPSSSEAASGSVRGKNDLLDDRIDAVIASRRVFRTIEESLHKKMKRTGENVHGSHVNSGQVGEYPGQGHGYNGYNGYGGYGGSHGGSHGGYGGNGYGGSHGYSTYSGGSFGTNNEVALL